MLLPRIIGVRRLLLIALLLELAMATSMGLLLWVQWRESERFFASNAHEETTTVARRIGQTLDRVDLLMSLMVERLATSATASTAMSTADFPPASARRSDAVMAGLEDIARHLPATGRLLFQDDRRQARTIRGWAVPTPLSDTLFALHADQGIPFIITGNADLRRPAITISRRVDRPDGRFGGILAVTLDVDSISGLQDNPDLSMSGVTLVSEDGAPLAHWTRAVLKPADLPALPVSIGSWLEGRRHAVVAAEPVPGFALRAVAAFRRPPFLRQWLNQLFTTVGAFFAVTILAAFGTASVARETRRRMAAEAGLSAANAELQALIDATRKLASVDALTGIANRRAFDERLEEEMSRARRSLRPLSMIMLDLDHFKRVNDRHGHTFGDQVLADSARVLRSVLRETDVAARYGGEEFAVILPDTDVNGAHALGERLRRAFEQPHHVLEDGTGGRRALTVTASVGVTQHRIGDDPVSFVARADAALYQSKSEGRNRISSDRTIA